jgi:hypothetical protein
VYLSGDDEDAWGDEGNKIMSNMVDQQDKEEKEDGDADIAPIEEVLEFVQLLEEEKEEAEEANEEEELVAVTMKATVAKLKDIAKAIKVLMGGNKCIICVHSRQWNQ